MLNNIKRIVGEEIRYIGRSAAMGDIEFGKLIEIIDHKNQKKMVGFYALHIDTSSWRIRDSKTNQTILGYSDMFEPTKTLDLYEDFEWDIQGNNLYDKKAKELIKVLNGVIVKNVEVSENADFKITLSNGMVIDFFSTHSSDVECWRFFAVDNDEDHQVATGLGLQLAEIPIKIDRKNSHE